jgi:hypothetical protein
MRRRLTLALLASSLSFACGPSAVEAPPPPPPVAPPAPVVTVVTPPPPPPMSRADWNRIAVRLDMPLFWAGDDNGNDIPDEGEVRRLLFYPATNPPTLLSDLSAANTAIHHYNAESFPSGASPEEIARQRLVLADLDQGAPSLIFTPKGALNSEEEKVLAALLRAAAAIDELKATISGAAALASRLPPGDLASQSLFRRDWGPKCAGAKTMNNATCSAIPGAPRPLSDAYPAALQADADFCAKLEKRPDAKKLLDPFTVVREEGGKLTAVPYSVAYKPQMEAVAIALTQASSEVADPKELPLKSYLTAAAKSFRDNDWLGADEAWAKMNARNSRLYVRVAPDEVLSDPCSRKAQFHLTFARIDQGSLAWQEKLAPVEQQMEQALADLAGPPYKVRRVAFHLPDFIQIVVNAGDDRPPVGATAGQSLPNWGKVESEGRGRTVAMTNIGTDPDSLAVSKKRLSSLVDGATMAGWTESQEPGLVGTILHEATHNLGPTYTYLLQGKKPEAVFGGGLSAMLEELKAETGALYFLGWIQRKGLVSPEFLRQAYTAWLEWALRHIATGVRSGAEDQPYSQLAAIQVGFLLDEGALVYADTAVAANGTDHGAFSLSPDKLGPAIDKLMKVVIQIKAKNDKAGADALVARYVDGPVVPQKVIAERALRFPQTTFVYAVSK